jgi:hypothetical protein
MVLFQTERAALKPTKVIANTYDAIFLSTAVVTMGSALMLSGSLDKISKALLTTTSVASLACYTINCKVTEKARAVNKVFEEIQWDSMKYSLKEEEEVYELAAQINGASRKVEVILNKSNPWEWQHWARQGKVVEIFPPVGDLTGEQIEQPTVANNVAVPQAQVNTFTQETVNSVVAPDEMAQLQTLAAAYPNFVRIDSDWLDELCRDASNPNMSKRFNHHFCITGETQSGKSTIAGVIVNKISANSGKPSTVIGSDPKDGVTRWLCKFSFLFEGYQQVDNWIQFAFRQAEEQKKAYAKNPEETGELFFIQDEVDTTFGNGKGFLGFQGANKKLAASQAQSAQSLWNYLVKFTAGMKGHYIGLGQSPLSQDTGLSRPAYKSVCFIALGSTVDYIFEHPADFLRVNKETQEILNDAAEFMKNAGLRFALVVPMRGNPYIALIPQFDIESMQVSTNVKEIADSDPNLKTLPQLEAEMMEWVQNLDELPSPVQVKEKWESMSGKPLEANQLKAILKGLGLME